MSLHPENHGKYWTQNETNHLMKEIKLIDIKEIARVHKRTENAIFLKIIRESAKLCDNNDQLTLYDLSIITTLKISNLIQGFKKINYTKFINHYNDYNDNNYNDNNYNDNDYNDNDNDNNDNNDEKTFNSYYVVIPSIFVLTLILLWKSFYNESNVVLDGL
jgi:hypothetical protein